MTNKLSLFEFIRYNDSQDFRGFVSDLVKILQEALDPRRLDKTKLDVYAPEGARIRLKNKAEEVILHLAALLRDNPTAVREISNDVEYLRDIELILKQFKSEVGSQLLVNIKTILGRAEQLLPNAETNFQHGQLANDDATIMPVPNNTPSQTINSPLANQASSRAGARFDAALGLNAIKDLGRSK